MKSLPANLQIVPEWLPVLVPVAGDLQGAFDVIQEDVSAGVRVFPEESNIFRALKFAPDHYRVLILGQDPYPTYGHANGLAFSVAPDVYPLPKSLNNIYRELHSDTGIIPPPHGDLTSWEEQGVMLINTALTVREGEAGSHTKIGWLPVVQEIVRFLASRQSPLVAVLWGKHAAGFLPELGFIGSAGANVFADDGVLLRTEYLDGAYPNTVAFTSAHPSPLSAHRGFFGSKPFSRVNELLLSLGVAPIDWIID